MIVKNLALSPVSTTKASGQGVLWASDMKYSKNRCFRLLETIAKDGEILNS